MAELTLFSALINAMNGSKSLNSVPAYGGWRRILEPFAGAWQRNIHEERGTLLCYPTLYACTMRIVTDIGKLPFVLKQEGADQIWKKASSAAYDPVLRKPNSYQTAQQFRESWALSKLTQGNAYILKGRDNRGVVTTLYPLDPNRVLPMVSDTGAVFYQLYTDRLNGLPEGYPAEQLIVPAREIIHDRCITLFHWLIGVPPVAAAYWPAAKNLKILKSSTDFFANNAQPGGILTAPAGMSETDAQAVKAYWETNYTGENAGKIAVIGADMKFTSFAMKGADAQLVEQMRYSDEQICQPFGIPPFKVGIGAIPAGLGVDAINLLYYNDALQSHIEAMEYLLDEGLSVPAKFTVELDTDPLMRMDVGKQAEVETKLVGGKVKTPDEARARIGLSPTSGGDTLWGQHQDYPLGVLRDRDDLKPIESEPPPSDGNDSEKKTEKVRRLEQRVWEMTVEKNIREDLQCLTQ